MRDGNWKFMEHKPQIIKLFEHAGITNSLIHVVEPAGYGQLTSANISLFGNINNTREDIVGLTRKAFYEAIGIYRSRIFEAASPLYWVSFIIYFPKKSLKFIGVKGNNTIINIIQIIYWIVSVIITLLNVSEIKFITDLKIWINSL